MSLEDVIDSLNSDQNILVTRYSGGTFTDGIWTPGSPSTLRLLFCLITPATGMARIVGGRDMRADEQGQKIDDTRACYTNVELRTREVSRDPDQVTFDGSQWVVVRTEHWQLNDEIVFRSLLVREVRGSG